MVLRIRIINKQYTLYFVDLPLTSWSLSARLLCLNTMKADQKYHSMNQL